MMGGVGWVWRGVRIAFYERNVDLQSCLGPSERAKCVGLVGIFSMI